jgi:stringent starvation protein A
MERGKIMISKEDSALEKISNRKSVMTLFSDPDSIYSHMARIVLFEKGIFCQICDVDMRHPPEDLVEINPYCTLPTLVDRELIVYDYRLVIDYLDERFPHPPLMPVDPVLRAQYRLALLRFEQDWFSLVRLFDSESPKVVKQAKSDLLNAIIVSTEIFKSGKYFLSDDFTILDCVVSPLIWKLPEYGIELPKSAKPIKDYIDRVVQRDSFKASLNQIDFIIED